MTYKRDTEVRVPLSSLVPTGKALQPIQPGETRDVPLKALLEIYYRFSLEKDTLKYKGYDYINNGPNSDLQVYIGKISRPALVPSASGPARVDDGGGHPMPPAGSAQHLRTELILEGTVLASCETTTINDTHLVSPIPKQSNKYILRLINKSQSEVLGDLSINVQYLTMIPLLKKQIAFSFFQNAFDSIWNNRSLRYMNVGVRNNKLIISYDPGFAELYRPEKPLETVIDIPILDVTNTDITFRFDFVANRQNQPQIKLSITFTKGRIYIPGLIDIPLPSNPIIINYDIVLTQHREFKLRVSIPLLESVLSRLGNSEAVRTVDFLLGAVGHPDAISNTIEDKKKAVLNAFNPIADSASAQKQIYRWFLGRNDYTYVDKLSCISNNQFENTGANTILIDYHDDIPNLPIELIDPSPIIHEGHTIGHVDINDQPPVHEVHVVPRNSQKVKHIIVVMMENRSFDHMLGYLSLPNNNFRNVDGLKGNESNIGLEEFRDPNNPENRFIVNHLTETKIVPGPAHETDNMRDQLGPYPNGLATMQGFVKDYQNRLAAYYIKTQTGTLTDKRRFINVHSKDVMSYYTEAQVPTYDYLAREFAICNRWFCAHPGPTLTNRFISLTGDVLTEDNGDIKLDHPTFDEMSPIPAKTVFDYLTEANVSWKHYEQNYCTLRLFGKYTFDQDHIKNIEEFYRDAQQGTLPSVVFIDPDFIDAPPGNDDHPPADIKDGQAFIGKIVDKLQNSPQWNDCLLVVTYDENGGFYDHVVPPAGAPISNQAITLGPRVPTFLVSPYIPRTPTGIRANDFGITVDNTVYDHTTIIASILRRFCPGKVPNLHPRTNAAKDLFGLLTLERPRAVRKIKDMPFYNQSIGQFRRAARQKYNFDLLDDKDGFHHLVLAAGMVMRSA